MFKFLKVNVGEEGLVVITRHYNDNLIKYLQILYTK